MRTWRCPHGYVRQKDGTLQCEDCKEIKRLKDEVESLKACLAYAEVLELREWEAHQVTKAKVAHARAGLDRIRSRDDWGTFGGDATNILNEMNRIK